MEFVRILTPYVAVRGLVRDQVVLDLGCGTGHGAWLFLNSSAGHVVVADIDGENIRRVAQICRGHGNFHALVTDALELGFRESLFDVVTCFEVLEHVVFPVRILAEMTRVLRKNGLLLLTTPNRSVRLLRGQSPWYEGHVTEYSIEDLSRLLGQQFPYFKIYGIYGVSPYYWYYRKLWNPDPFKAYRVARGLRHFVPSPVKRWIRDRPLRGRLRDDVAPKPGMEQIVEIPRPVASEWPFFLDEAGRDCLNLFAVCGLDPVPLEEAIRKIEGVNRGKNQRSEPE